MAQIALAWLLAQPQVTSVIVGAKRPEQLADNIAATQVILSADELKQLDEASRLPSEYPGWMLERQGQYRRQQIVDSQISIAAWGNRPAHHWAASRFTLRRASTVCITGNTVHPHWLQLDRGRLLAVAID